MLNLACSGEGWRELCLSYSQSTGIGNCTSQHCHMTSGSAHASEAWRAPGFSLLLQCRQAELEAGFTPNFGTIEPCPAPTKRCYVSTQTSVKLPEQNVGICMHLCESEKWSYIVSKEAEIFGSVFGRLIKYTHTLGEMVNILISQF